MSTSWRKITTIQIQWSEQIATVARVNAIEHLSGKVTKFPPKKNCKQ